ncbi:MAG: hypothetical protein R3250_04585, partial [Melioribacteraceae bacterium]|nr:hypothetical protein [Melioribacteraceae bacterium]
LFGGGVKADATPIGVGLTVSAWEFNAGDASTGATTLVTLDNTDSPPIYNPAHLIESSFDIDTLLTPAA